MTVHFLEHFGDDPRANQERWQRSPANPVIPYGAEWCREFVAPSSVLIEDGVVTLYTEGGSSDRENFGCYTASLDAVSGPWQADSANPLLEPSEDGFDRGSVFDPYAIRVGSELRIYYSATSGGAHEFAEHTSGAGDVAPVGEFIGMARWTGAAFERQSTPVLEGRCPCAFEHEGALYLFYVKVVRGGYRIFAARSTDGLRFEPVSDTPVLDVGPTGAWDSFTVTTPKVFADDGRFVMLYAGDDRQIDDPTGVGIATSDDLLHWDRHPGNPVLTPGPSGAFDSISVASSVPFMVNGSWHIAYAGGDQLVVDGLRSQVGIARMR
jgi:predicted GH43/DUF377 family glycosyl hydrolase